MAVLASMIAGLLIWAAFFTIAYAVTALGCAFGFAGTRLGGLPLANLVTLAAAAIALGMIGGVALQGLRAFRAASGEVERFRWAMTVAFAAAGAIATLFVALPGAMILPPCQ